VDCLPLLYRTEFTEWQSFERLIRAKNSPILFDEVLRKPGMKAYRQKWPQPLLRLRNVYKPSNIIANTLKQALDQRHKLLLTATPLQNSLLELFGLVSFIDEHTFGDLKMRSRAWKAGLHSIVLSVILALQLGHALSRVERIHL
jgi:SNF2-related domain